MTKRSRGADSADQIRRDQIDAEHHNLRESMVQLREAPDLPLIIAHLMRLRDELVEHFKLEEGDDGLAQAIGETAPNALNTLDRLFHEHDEFLTAIDGLIHRANDAMEGVASDLKSDIRTLCTRLEQHEATETELLSDAVFTDLGTSG